MPNGVEQVVLDEKAKARLVIRSISDEMSKCAKSPFGRARWAGLLDAKRTVEVMFDVR